MADTKKKKKTGFTGKVLAGLILGIIAGISLHYLVPAGFIRDKVITNGILYVVSQGFIRLLQMLVVPLVFCSITCGAMAVGDTKTLGKVGLKTFCFYLATTVIAITIALAVGQIIQPGIGIRMNAIQKADVNVKSTDTGFMDTILNIIPTNPLKALSDGNMLQIIFYALLLGLVLGKLGDKASMIRKAFEQLNEVMMELTNVVMVFSPIGVFCMIAQTFAGIGFDAFIPMIKYMLAVVIGLGLHCFIVYPLLLSAFARISPRKFFRKFFPVMTFAFSTDSSTATIPVTIDTLTNKIGVDRKISSFTIPLGATINMDGTAIMQGVAVIFTAEIYGMTLTPKDLITVILMATLASIGTATVPSMGIITLSMVLTAVGLPTDGIGMIMGVDRILDMLRTAVNVTGDAVCTTIVAKQNHSFDQTIFNQN